MMEGSRQPEEGKTGAVKSGLHIVSQAGLRFLFGSGLLWLESPEDRVSLLLEETTRYRSRS